MVFFPRIPDIFWYLCSPDLPLHRHPGHQHCHRHVYPNKEANSWWCWWTEGLCLLPCWRFLLWSGGAKCWPPPEDLSSACLAELRRGWSFCLSKPHHQMDEAEDGHTSLPHSTGTCDRVCCVGFLLSLGSALPFQLGSIIIFLCSFITVVSHGLGTSSHRPGRGHF